MAQFSDHQWFDRLAIPSNELPQFTQFQLVLGVIACCVCTQTTTTLSHISARQIIHLRPIAPGGSRKDSLDCKTKLIHSAQPQTIQMLPGYWLPICTKKVMQQSLDKIHSPGEWDAHDRCMWLWEPKSLWTDNCAWQWLMAELSKHVAQHKSKTALKAELTHGQGGKDTKRFSRNSSWVNTIAYLNSTVFVLSSGARNGSSRVVPKLHRFR